LSYTLELVTSEWNDVLQENVLQTDFVVLVRNVHGDRTQHVTCSSYDCVPHFVLK